MTEQKTTECAEIPHESNSEAQTQRGLHPAEKKKIEKRDPLTGHLLKGSQLNPWGRTPNKPNDLLKHYISKDLDVLYQKSMEMLLNENTKDIVKFNIITLLFERLCGKPIAYQDGSNPSQSAMDSETALQILEELKAQRASADTAEHLLDSAPEIPHKE